MEKQGLFLTGPLLLRNRKGLQKIKFMGTLLASRFSNEGSIAVYIAER